MLENENKIEVNLENFQVIYNSLKYIREKNIFLENKNFEEFMDILKEFFS